MIVTPGVTNDTPATAIDVNLFEKVLEFRNGTPWTDPYTLRNWLGFTYSPPPNTGPAQNPLPNSIVIRDVQSATICILSQALLTIFGAVRLLD